jgi:hypothetical protein
MTNRAFWTIAGALYGLLIFGIAEAVILPRAASALRDVPLPAFALAHAVYGIVLGAIVGRNHQK